MNFRRLKIAGVAIFSLTVAVASGIVSLAADERRIPSSITSQTVKGEVLLIMDEFIVVMEPTGKGVHVLFDKSAGAKRDSTIKVGDQVEVRVTPDGRAQSVMIIKHGAQQSPEVSAKGARAGKS